VFDGQCVAYSLGGHWCSFTIEGFVSSWATLRMVRSVPT
jgi:hypothetical protein